MSFSDEYLAYLESDAWQLQREAALARAAYRCERCSHPADLEVHHLTYDRLGHEEPKDLQVLCPPCHEAADRQRRARVQWEARFEGWAEKVYGEEWFMEYDRERLEDEFEVWLERRGE